MTKDVQMAIATGVLSGNDKMRLFKIFTTSGDHLVQATSPNEARELFRPKQPKGCRIKKIKLVKETD